MKKMLFRIIIIIMSIGVLVLLECATRFIQQVSGVEDYYYIPNRTHWNLDKFTNIVGQRDGKEEYRLYPSTCSYSRKVKVKKDSSTTRIITIGTSVVEGFGVQNEENFTSVLQRLCDKEYGKDKYECINGGLGGYVSYQLLIYFKEILLHLEPDIVILYVGCND